MIVVRILLLILLFPLFVVLRLLGCGRNDIINLPEGHPEMAQAIAEARAALPEFRRLLAAPESGMENFSVKARFKVEGGSEHIWVNDLEPLGEGFRGKIGNEPRDVTDLKLGSTVEITEDMVTDWAYSKNGFFFGHHTTRVLLPRMSKKMRRQVEQMFGWSAEKPA